MRKADIANEIYERIGISKKEAADIIEIVLNTIKAQGQGAGQQARAPQPPQGFALICHLQRADHAQPGAIDCFVGERVHGFNHSDRAMRESSRKICERDLPGRSARLRIKSQSAP